MKHHVHILVCVSVILGTVIENVDGSLRDRLDIVEIDRAIRRFKRNPFQRSGRSSSDSDLREKEDDDDSSSTTFQGDPHDYCDKFEQHFSFYCIGEIDRSGKTDYVLKKFCPSYKQACPNKPITSSVSLTSWPTDPFEKKISIPTRSEHLEESGRHHAKTTRLESLEDSKESAEDEELYYVELRKRYPCKPDCDRRIFPHCTEECKCDYIYPAVQRFCNPPPMPIFLNTCRLWYHGCPKYEQYHYASQFVHSKAEKGKVLPGSASSTAAQYGLDPNQASTSLRTHRALALAPIRRNKRSEGTELELIVPPPIPHPTQLADSRKIQDEIEMSDALTAPRSRAILHEKLKQKTKNRRSSKRRKLHRKRRHHRRFSLEPLSTTARPATPKEVWRTLKALNSLTNGGIGLTRSPATLKGGQAGPGGLDGLIQSVTQPKPHEEAAREWANVAQNPDKFTKDVVQAASGSATTTVDVNDEVNSTKLEEPVDFSSLKTRLLAANAAKTVMLDEKNGKPKAFQGSIPVLATEAAQSDDTFKAFDGLSDSRGLVHVPRTSSPFTKPGLWEPNPADPHSRDPTNKYWYHPESVMVDWLNGQMTWGAHWAVPAAGVGGTDGFSSLHFPSVGTFLNIPDDYD
ncbi:unnamed protein product [Caenorhabditis bovis]|uniref:Uncharacterized protein n=1 Tax=Caenorhabditis bovis TaxID=2654633 RepID=A0A8S1EMI8_9PELO|nr:unnamed protein product [Caenorhabditis bovis]